MDQRLCKKRGMTGTMNRSYLSPNYRVAGFGLIASHAHMRNTGRYIPIMFLQNNQTWKSSAFYEDIYIYVYIWVNYNDLTATSLGIMVNKGNHPQMALIQASELL